MSVPVLLVTGFLGAGKTTFINRLLQADHGRRIAAIVNDFGAINIDAELLGGSAEGVIGLKNGCICCSLQGDLIRTLKSVLDRTPAPDLIVIEASGIADPAGILQSLMDPVIWHQASLESVVCVVDAVDAAARRQDPLWQAQCRAADLFCLSKTAEPGAAGVPALTAELTLQGGRHAFDMEEGLPLPLLLGPRDPQAGPRAVTPAGAVLRDDRFTHVEWRHPGAVSLAAFQAVIGRHAPQLLRAKGILRFEGREGGFVFQLAGTRATLAASREGTPEGCSLVFIGEGSMLDRAALLASLDALA